jgi:hypothetical protein
MSNRYKGGVISATPPTTTGGEDGTASGAWTLEQQAQLQAAGLWPAQPTGPWIEQVFSTYLYTGTGATQTITNGIDLSTKGGLVWGKSRSNVDNHRLTDTIRGASDILVANSTSAAFNQTQFSSFNSNGFTLAAASNSNSSGYTYASWTFREQPKFFDIVTYSGNSVNGRTISHGLGSVPGFIIIKSTTASANWTCYHRSIGATNFVKLNATDASDVGPFFNDTTPTSTQFTVSGDFAVNQSGETYVAYLFAHDAGGFGLTGTDNVISCGSFTVDGSGNSSINLGYEPQWLLMKQTNTTGSWLMQDTMRGQTADNGYSRLLADTSGAETSTTTGFIRINATGFSTNGATGLVGDHIYIAIRRGPMKVPTSGTSVLDVETWSGNSSGNRNISVGFPADLNFFHVRNEVNSWSVTDRLRGNGRFVQFNVTSAEANADPDFPLFNSLQNELKVTGTTAAYINETGYNQVFYSLRRAPGFFDAVCYTGTGVQGRSVTHNLTVSPEIVIIKGRNQSGYEWILLSTAAPAANSLFYFNTGDAGYSRTGNPDYFGNSSSVYTAPSSTIISLGSDIRVNNSGTNYVAYLFATCAGVSKCGSYTGTGALQTVNCGFTSGARFVFIKRADSTGNWYLWDSARGITSGNDPYLLLNSAGPEVTGTNYVDSTSTGFQVTATAPADINANGGTYIFLAIA